MLQYGKIVPPFQLIKGGNIKRHSVIFGIQQENKNTVHSNLCPSLTVGPSHNCTINCAPSQRYNLMQVLYSKMFQKTENINISKLLSMLKILLIALSI